MLEIGLDSDPYSTFLFAMRSPKTKEKVIGRLRMFLISLGYPMISWKCVLTDNIWWNRHYLLLVKNMRIISNTIDGFSENGV